jgi:hypothetical protein
MLRRPRYEDPTVVEMAIVVFSGRAPSNILSEHAYTGISFTPGTNTVDLTYSGDIPPVRVGSWILDATLTTYAADPITGNSLPEPYGFFYRVVGVTQGTSVLHLELQTNIRPFRTVPAGTPPTAHTGTLVVLENVAEVFEVGPGWQP